MTVTEPESHESPYTPSASQRQNFLFAARVHALGLALLRVWAAARPLARVRESFHPPAAVERAYRILHIASVPARMFVIFKGGRLRIAG